MRVGFLFTRQFQRRFISSLVLSAFFVWLLWPGRKHEPHPSPLELQQRFPLLWRHVHTFNGTGGGRRMNLTAWESLPGHHSLKLDP